VIFRLVGHQVFFKEPYAFSGAKVESRLDFKKVRAPIQNKGQVWGFQEVLGWR
jgi:hypothetical protein